MPTNEREWITTTEAARRTGYSIAHIARLARAGKLPYLDRMPGERGDFLFDPEVIAELARKRIAEHRKAIRELEEANA